MEEGQARFACKFWVAQELEPALMNESSKEADLDLSERSPVRLKKAAVKGKSSQLEMFMYRPDIKDRRKY